MKKALLFLNVNYLFFCRKLQLVLLLICFSITVQCQNPQIISIDGMWRFTIDSTGNGIKDNWQNGIPSQVTREVKVPHTWNIEPGTEDYFGKAWYQKDVEIPTQWAGKSIYLKFAAVYHDAIVYLNGQKVGEHLHAGYTPFTFDVSKFVVGGQTNKLVVLVSNELSENNLPYINSFDWTNDGGIYRSVSLYVCGKPSIRYAHVTPTFSPNDSVGNATVSIKLNEENSKSATFNLVCKERKSGKIIIKETKTLKSASNLFTCKVPMGKITPWHFDNPFLYSLEVEVVSKKEVSDAKTESFGFKKVEIRGDKLYLNGEQVRLPGIEYMPSSHPAYGAAEPEELTDSVVRMMKNLNVVITRVHWQQNDAFFDMMDRYGILVQEELPWWQKPTKLTPQLELVAKQQLTEMVENHYNHPCIFAWGINNEVAAVDTGDNLKLISFVRGLDSTRMVNIVENNLNKNLQKDPTLLGDLPSWNEYVGTWNGGRLANLAAQFEKITPILHGRPLLITEAGLCEPRFAGGDARRINDMFNHVNHWRTLSYIAGYIYFCLNDYRTQMGEEGIGKYKIRRHGITDMYMRPKASYAVFKQVSSPVEIFKVVKLNVNDAVVGISVKNTIPYYVLRNYLLEYKTMDGNVVKLPVATLHPGEKAELVLKDVNPSYSFRILRPTGFVVAEY